MKIPVMHMSPHRNAAPDQEMLSITLQLLYVNNQILKFNATVEGIVWTIIK